MDDAYGTSNHAGPLTCLTQFADELLEYIFCSPSLDYKDIINLSETCLRFSLITRSNEIWKQMLLRRWLTPEHHLEGDDMKTKFKYRLQTELMLIKKLCSLARTAYEYDEVPYSLMSEFKDLYTSDQENSTVLDLLYMFICEKDKTGDINRKYYARKVYQYIYHNNLKRFWKELLDSSQDNAALIEKGAILIAQWCNPEARINSDVISEKLNIIASSVKDKLPEAVTIAGGHITTNNAAIIVRTMNEVLYHDIGFKGNSNSYYDIKNSFIHKVLERKLGIPISLAVVYIAVARRLGLHMQGVNFPGHFLIRIMLEDTESEPMYIDVFNKGSLLNADQCITQFISFDQYHWPREMLFQLADKRKLFIRMVTNIINILKESTVIDSRNLPFLRTAHELMYILDPDDAENKLLLSKIYLHQGINLEDVAATLRGMFASNERNSDLLDSYLINTAGSRKQAMAVMPKYRSHPENREVQFRVGALMKHRRYNYICVIYGWDPVCRMDDVWQAQMGVHRLHDKDRQPFYHVLANDGSSRYAAQESLMPALTNSPILHPDIGRYFKYFNGNHYLFTEKLSEAYPEDEIIPENDSQS